MNGTASIGLDDPLVGRYPAARSSSWCGSRWFRCSPTVADTFIATSGSSPQSSCRQVRAIHRFPTGNATSGSTAVSPLTILRTIPRIRVLPPYPNSDLRRPASLVDARAMVRRSSDRSRASKDSDSGFRGEWPGPVRRSSGSPSPGCRVRPPLGASPAGTRGNPPPRSAGWRGCPTSRPCRVPSGAGRDGRAG